ncbi:hypothetical protein [Micromonospora vulcania]|uniref:Integral membrane protein n=1 Tax=Micromonospora vulcania TaxID=1441873 RepID=A0ABW1H3V9_9ACTN
MLAIAVVLLIAPIGVLAVRHLNRWTRRLTPRSPVPTRLAGYLTLAAAAMYVFGFVHLTYWATPRETCIVRYGTWDGRYGHASYWPLERKCADDIDMVPGYVNPLIVILLTGALTCALIAVVQLVRHRRVGFAPRS